MSQKGSKGGAPPRNDEGVKGPLGRKPIPEGLIEISHDCHTDWDYIMALLKDYFRDKYQDLESICQDPMTMTIAPEYWVYEPPKATERELAAITKEKDPTGDKNKIFMGLLSGRNSHYIKLVGQQELDKKSAYGVIRSMCSPQLNSMLSVDAAFLACAKNNPLALLNAIKRLVTTRKDGNEELDRQKALSEWFGLKMDHGEAMLSYGRRAVKTFERLTTTGIPAEEQPKPKQQSMRFIDGLDGSIPAYHGYKMYLINAKQQTDQDIYPETLVEAIMRATRFETSFIENVNASLPAATPHSAFGAQQQPEDRGKKGGKQSGKGKGKGQKDKHPGKDSKSDTDKDKPKIKFEGECFKCGKIGHRKSECRSKAKEEPKAVKFEKTPEPTNKTINHSSYYTSFGNMHDEEDDEADDDYRTCNVALKGSLTGHGDGISLQASRTSIQPSPTEAIFDTGATGTIITSAEVLSEIWTCRPTVFKGLHGSLTVTKVGRLGDIGIVHFDDRAALSIISASDILLQGHNWEFQRGEHVDDDAFLVHTAKNTYRFQHRGGLYICDLATRPEPRLENLKKSKSESANIAIGGHKAEGAFFTAPLPTTTANEAAYSKREVSRSFDARRLQASLGFPPDSKLISALNAGAFLNCDILPEDVSRATAIWGTNIAALKGRTVRARPFPALPMTKSHRDCSEQHMHCDVMFVNKQPFLVSITHPLGIVLVACVENLSAPILRQSIRRMFGTIGSRGIKVTRFSSDNERGIAALSGDMNAMGVAVVPVGPGQHDHVVERMIRHLKETIRSTIHSLPYLVTDAMMNHLVLSCSKKLLLFPSSTRSDKISPFEAFFGRKADMKRDIGPPFGTYCQVTNRCMSNGMEQRTIGCLYLEPKMNGTGTHAFLRLDNRAAINANHYVVLPIPPIVITTVNGWAAKNRLHTSIDPTFTFHDRDITNDVDNDVVTTTARAAPPAAPPIGDLGPLNDPYPTKIPTAPIGFESPTAPSPMEIRGETETAPDTENLLETSGEISEPTESVEEIPEENAFDVAPTNVRTYVPRHLEHLAPREKSTRLKKPIDRLNLAAEKVSFQAQEIDKQHGWMMMSVTRGLKLFPEKTAFAIESEVKSLLAKDTFSGVHMSQLTDTQRKKILRSIMNVTEKFLPTLNSEGNRENDKIKARFCVDGRGQVRADYKPEEIESPTASIAAIFTIAQLAAAEKRFVMVGDVGSAYLNAKMPPYKPDKILHMMITKDVADEIIRQDKSFAAYQRTNGSILVRLNRALYGCIESAKLWYEEIAGTLRSNGFTANPRDLCVFNKDVKGKQFTIVVYVDDLKMTCVDKGAVLAMEQILRKVYGQFRTTQVPIVSYLGMTWDYSETGYVKVSQAGMIQDVVTAREETHKDRGTKLARIPHSPGAPHLFDRTPDCKLLNAKDAEKYHSDTATIAWICSRATPSLTTVLGELSKRVKGPSCEDDKKLDRVISFAKYVRDVPLRLKADLPPRVTVSIDAAFANRDDMKSTTGMCVTLGVGFFITSSKVQKLNSKSSTEAEIIAVSDGMNIPLWLADFIRLQGYDPQPVRLEQDNQSCITLLTKGRSTAETTRFIEIRKFWISDYIKNGAVDIVYVPTAEMTSDYFTKPLQGALFSKMFKRIMGQE